VLRKAELRREQEALLDALFQLECHRSDVRLDPVILRAPGTAGLQYVEIPLFYATDRKRSGTSGPYGFYGPDHSDIEYGELRVTVPLKHTIGEIELPKLWRLELSPNPDRHFVIKAVAPVASPVFWNALMDVGNRSGRTLLLFVHGYNVNFDEAVLRTAQLTHDLRFAGVTMLYSWPSAGTTSGYWRDEESALLSEAPFQELLTNLAAGGWNTIYVVAHSMGNRIVANAMGKLAEQNRDLSRVRELLLAAPDINAEVFRKIIVPRLLTLPKTRTTIYASSNDVALRATRAIHQYSRLGDVVEGRVHTFSGMATVDASGTTTWRRAFGHSYVSDSPQVLADIQALIQLSLDPGARGLRQVPRWTPPHWTFP
jgi:esterase/lipase superfamily enzyme